MVHPKNAPEQQMPGSKNAGLNFDLTFGPEVGKPEIVAPGIVRIVAPNSGPYTFTGTNTYLIGTDPLFILDPGPDEQSHLDAIVQAVDGRTVTAVLLTHTHRDHSALAPRLSQSVGAPIWFGGPHRLSRPLRRFEINALAGACDWKLQPERSLSDGVRIAAGALELQVIATPGHCANHLSFGIIGQEFIFSGDHVMGWNSTLVATPDGDMSDYFNSLERMIAAPWTHYLPGHGGTIEDGPHYAGALKAHREMRNTQIIEAVDAGARHISQIVGRLYPGVPRATRRAAAMTVMAHVEHLAREHRLGLSWRFGRAGMTPI